MVMSSLSRVWPFVLIEHVESTLWIEPVPLYNQLDGIQNYNSRYLFPMFVDTIEFGKDCNYGLN